MANTDELLLIDLSSLAHPLWHMSQNEPDPNHTSTQVIARVRALASDHPHAAVCCDSGKSFRAEIEPSYKANRPESVAPLQHQITLAAEALKRDGFPVWAVKGFEADDLIASATAQALAIDGTTVLIATADKDLLQLVNDRVTIKNVAPNANGNLRDVAAVVEKFGVQPSQMGDWLCLVGDASDNIKGAKGIGAVSATKLLQTFESLAALYRAIDAGQAKVQPSILNSLTEFRDRWPTVRSLVALRTDVEIPFAEIAAERTAPPMEETATMSEPEPFKEGNDANDAPLPFTSSAPKASGTLAGQPSIPNGADSGRASIDAVTAVGAVSRLPQSDAAALVPSAGGSGQLVSYQPVEFGQQLEPRNMAEAKNLAQMMYDSRLFSAYGTPQAVLATVLAGRELGLPAMASLRAFHIIEGKPQLSAGIIQSLVIKSGKAKYFRCSERTAERATFLTKRGDDPEMALTYTIEEGKAAWPKDEAAWKKSGWGKNPADMLVARASSKLARLVYPDVVAGLYAPEEMD